MEILKEFVKMTWNKRNNLSFFLNELIEGLCVGDSRSIKIFIEIIKTLIIDTLLKNEYFEYNDIQGKITLLKLWNESFCFSPIVKIQFIEDMLIVNNIKKMLIDIIWDNDTTIKIAKKGLLGEKCKICNLTFLLKSEFWRILTGTYELICEQTF